MPAPKRSITTAKDALARLHSGADATRARDLGRFFKTGPGEYAEGDRFLGLTVPMTRAIVNECALALPELERLLASEWHEARLLALLLYVREFDARPKKGGPTPADVEANRLALYESYLEHTRHIDNWDLVDSSAETVVGGWLFDRSRAPLTSLARSTSLWERRIAMIATFRFIKEGQSDDALRIATILLRDEHDLIHKAVGWMLREVGKRCSRDILRAFLDEHAGAMPRTALRYALEHFAPEERARYMAIERVR